MKAPLFNWPVVRRLVLKDWYLHRWAIVATFVLDAFTCLTLRMVESPSHGYERDPTEYGIPLAYFGNVVAGYFFLFSHWTLVILFSQEKKAGTVGFALSLPIRAKDYVAAKLLANFLVFLVPWATLMLYLIFFILRQDTFPDGLVPFVVIMLLSTLAGYSLCIGIGSAREMDSWSIVALMAGTFFPMFFRGYVAFLPGISAAATSNDPTFSGLELGLVAFLLVAIGLSLTLPFYWRSRQPAFP